MSSEAGGVLYSLSLSSIGRSTHTDGSAAAHMRYVLRSGAVEGIVGRGIPATAAEAAAWMDAQEQGDRKNARVCDGVIVALPHQLTPEQRKALLRGWCDETSTGVPYIAAIHRPSREGDDRNHHAHIVFRDRDPTTGKRVMKSTEREFADRVRQGWERHVNAALKDAGIDARTDCRSHAARGIDRLPQLHVGAAATAAARRAERGGATPAGHQSKAEPLRSLERTVRNGAGARSRTRDVDYPTIDAGRTRSEENARRMTVNAARDRADARVAMEARLAAARATMAGVGLGMMPAQPQASIHAMPARTRTRAAAAAAEPARDAARTAPAAGRSKALAMKRTPQPIMAEPPPPAKALARALAMERTPQPAQPIMVPAQPIMVEPPPPAKAPEPPIPEPAIIATRETPAARTARLIIEGEEWLAAERAAGRMPAAAQAEAAPTTPPTPSPQPPKPTGGLLDQLTARGRAATGAAASIARQIAGLFAAGPEAPKAPAPARHPQPQPAAPTAAPAEPARRTDFGHRVQGATTADAQGIVRFYTTDQEQQPERDNEGIGGLEGVLRRSGVRIERKALFENTKSTGEPRSWIVLICQQRDLQAAVTRMGEAGEDLVKRLIRAGAESSVRFRTHVQPWLEHRKAEAAAKRAADKAAGKGSGRTGTGRGGGDGGPNIG